MALDINAEEKLNAEFAVMNADKIQELQPKNSFQIFILPNKCSSRVQAIISFLNTMMSRPTSQDNF